MEYCSFLEHVRETVQKRRGENSRVWIAPALKNNQECMDMLTILDGDANVAPAIYMEPYYQQYLAGETIEKISERILQYHSTHAKETNYDISFYRDFEKVRDRIVCRLVNYEKNQELLKRVPHRRFLDLAVIYYYLLDDDTFGKAEILVKNEHMQAWDSDPEELDDVAVSNTARLLPYECIFIADLLREAAGMEFIQEDMPEEVPQVSMYVLTNTARNFGAAVILYDTVLEALSEQFGNDFYLLPSSVHECMLIPLEDHLDAKMLRQMVCEINEECVAEDEVLGDSVYLYSRRERALSIIEPDMRANKKTHLEGIEPPTRGTGNHCSIP